MEDQRLSRDREDDLLEDARKQMMPGNSIVKGMVARLAATRFAREALAEKADLKAILFDNLIRYCVRGVEVWGGVLVNGYYASKSRGWRCDWERTVERRPPF